MIAAARVSARVSRARRGTAAAGLATLARTTPLQPTATRSRSRAWATTKPRACEGWSSAATWTKTAGLASSTKSTATDYLVSERGLSEAQATAVLKALKDSGAGSSDGTLKQVAKGIDNSSLQALVKAVDDIAERDTARNALAPASVEVTVPRDGYTFTIEGREGDSLQSLVEHGTELADYIECACQGQLMCSTCHVYVDEECLAQMDPPDDYEQDMIDIAYEPRDNSRLGCQLKLRADSLLKVQIPDSSNNYFN